MFNQISRVPIQFLIEGQGEASGELIRFLAPRTVEALLRSMPIHGRTMMWNEEVYFETPVRLGAEKARTRVEKGMIAYWPMSSAICIFVGSMKTYSPVNFVGRILENLELFSQIRPGTRITMELSQAATAR